ncbi:hypothetical protein ABPG72_022654 [Tetrahymena utriculariae]
MMSQLKKEEKVNAFYYNKKEKLSIVFASEFLKAKGKKNIKILLMKEIPKIIQERIIQIEGKESQLTSKMDVEKEEMNKELKQGSVQQTGDYGLLYLPCNLFNFICMFLKAKEIVNLMRVSRAMREKVLTQAQYAISNIALKLFFSNEIDAYVEYGEEEKYLACKVQRNNLIAEYMKGATINHLQRYSQLRSQIQHTPQVADLDHIFADILSPPMPIMKIRRENVGMHAHSWFQNKLVDVYYDNQTKSSKQLNSFNFASQAFRKINQGSIGSSLGNGTFTQTFPAQSSSAFGSSGANILSSQNQKSLGFFNNHFGASHKKLKFFSQTISEIQQKLIRQKQMPLQQQQQLLGIFQSLQNNTHANNGTNNNNFQMSNQHQFSQQNIEKLLDLIRWYRDFDEIQLITDSSNPEIQRYIQENTVVLTVLLVSTIFKKQCEFLYQYLELNNNHATYQDLISEYNLKWNAYQAAVIETQENLEEVYKSFNDLYQCEVGVKMYPQYSVLRVAAQHWTRIVLKPLQEKLFEAFFCLLQNRRYENLSYVVTADQQKIDPKLASIYYMPDKLEITSGELIQRFQRLAPQNVLFCGNATQCFTSNSNAISCNDKMYQEFFSKNSYYVDNMLYTFTENMMDLSVNEASVHWLGHTDMQVGEIYSDLHQNFLQKTALYFEELYNQVFFGYVNEWKQFLMGELKYCRKIVKESTFKLTNKLVLENFFKAFIKDVETRAQNAQLQQLQQQQQYGSAEESLLRQKLLLKGLTQQASYYILSEPKLRKVLESFKEMKEEEEDFNCKSVRDEDIEDINRYRQIKQKLDEDSFAFYDLIGNVDPSLIEKTKNLIRQKLLFDQINLFNRPFSSQEEFIFDYNQNTNYEDESYNLQSFENTQVRDQQDYFNFGLSRDIQDQNHEVAALGESLHYQFKSSPIPYDEFQLSLQQGFQQNFQIDQRMQYSNNLSLSGDSCLLLGDLNIKGSSDYLDAQQLKMFNDQSPSTQDSSNHFFDEIDQLLPNPKAKLVDSRRKNSQDVSTQDNSFNSNEIEEEFSIM